MRIRIIRISLPSPANELLKENMSVPSPNSVAENAQNAVRANKDFVSCSTGSIILSTLWSALRADLLQHRIYLQPVLEGYDPAPGRFG